jgi:hypothetical protein
MSGDPLCNLAVSEGEEPEPERARAQAAESCKARAVRQLTNGIGSALPHTLQDW